MNFWKKSLLARFVISYLTLSLVTVGVVAYVAYIQASYALTQSLHNRLEAVLVLKEDEFNQWLQNQRQEVVFLANLPELQRQATLLMAAGGSPQTPIYQDLLQFLNQTVASKPNLQEIFILTDVGGQVVISTNENNIGRYFVTDSYFTEGRKGTFVQNVYPSAQTSHPTLTIATPLYAEDTTTRIGVFVAHLNLERMDEIILERAGLGETGETYLVDPLNLFVSADRFGRDDFGRGVHSEGIDQAIAGRNGVGVYTNYAGVPVVGSYRWLEDHALALLAEMSQAEAFAPAQRMAFTIFLTGVLSASILTIGVYLLAKQITQPILAMTAVANKIRTGDLSQKVPVLTEDEVGQLASVFNAMHDNLQQARQQQEAYALSLESNVARRVAELETANQTLSRRAMLLEINSQVAQHITSTLDPDDLLVLVVNLLKARFDYYFVGIWLLSPQGDATILQAGSGFVGDKLTGLRIDLSATSLVARVCESGESRLVSDVARDLDYMPNEHLPDARSEMVLPLNIGNQTIGALNMQSRQTAAFTEDDRVMLRTMADQIAIAIRNARLYEMEKRRRHLAESLEQTGRILSSSLDLQQVPRRVLSELARVVPYERGSVLLQQEDILHFVAWQGFPEDVHPAELVIAIREDDVFERMSKTRQPIIVDDVSEDKGWKQQDNLPLNYSWLGVPLIVRNKTIGMLSLTRAEEGAFVADDKTLVVAFAYQAAIALENARLYDEITKFNEQLEQRVQERTEEVNRANRILEKLDRTKTDFINVTSHELRTPLALIQGYGQILQDELEAGRLAQGQRLIDNILRGTERLHNIVEKMLDVAQVETTSINRYANRIVVKELIENIYYTFEQVLETRQLQFVIQDLERLPSFQADGELIKKVFSHLVLNAIKYTPDGGTITVNGRSFIENSVPKLEIIVTDTGIGIDPEHQELIFEKFYQTGDITLHSSGETKFKGGGPGVGLAIVKGIVMAHDGRVWVESVGHDEKTYPGSAFHVVLPV